MPDIPSAPHDLKEFMWVHWLVLYEAFAPYTKKARNVRFTLRALWGVGDQAATRAASSGFSSFGVSVLISRSTATPLARLRDHLLSVSSETPLSAHVSLTRTVPANRSAASLAGIFPAFLITAIRYSTARPTVRTGAVSPVSVSESAGSPFWGLRMGLSFFPASPGFDRALTTSNTSSEVIQFSPLSFRALAIIALAPSSQATFAPSKNSSGSIGLPFLSSVKTRVLNRFAIASTRPDTSPPAFCFKYSLKLVFAGMSRLFRRSVYSRSKAATTFALNWSIPVNFSFAVSMVPKVFTLSTRKGASSPAGFFVRSANVSFGVSAFLAIMFPFVTAWHPTVLQG